MHVAVVETFSFIHETISYIAVHQDSSPVSILCWEMTMSLISILMRGGVLLSANGLVKAACGQTVMYQILGII